LDLKDKLNTILLLFAKLFCTFTIVKPEVTE